MNYYSHYREDDGSYQLNRDHQQNVAELCERKCGIPLLKKTAYIAGLSHDDGKNTEKWQEYFLENCRKDAGKGREKCPPRCKMVWLWFFVALPIQCPG